MLKRALAGLTAIVMACSNGCYFSSSYVNNNLDINAPPNIERFEDNNTSLSQEVRDEAARSVELVVVSAEYQFTGPDGNQIIGSLSTGGSAAIVEENYAITAYHVIEMPRFVNSYILQEDSALLDSLSNFTDPELLQFIMIGGAEAEIISEPKISLAGIEGINVVCPNYPEGEPSYDHIDYALLQIPSASPKLSPIFNSENLFVGGSDRLEVGDLIYTFGYPLSLGRFASQGIVSAVDGFNEESPMKDYMFTTDAAISPGNSGGAAFALHNGKLYYVGVTVASFRSGQNMNVVVRIDDILEDISRNGIYLRVNPSNLNPTNINLSEHLSE